MGCIMFHKLIVILPLIFCLPTIAMAKFVAVLETGSDIASKEIISDSDRRYITNVLREQAVKVLPAAQNFTIMTRENINAMLPPGKSIEECEGSCLAETGRNIAADYVAQARIESVGGALALSVEMYETASNKLISSFNGRGSNLDELLAIAQQNSPSFFLAVKSSGSFIGSGFGDFSTGGAFDYQGFQQYVIEITSTPAGAIPSIDGKANPKCLSTPCKVQVAAGSHLFVLTKDRYIDAEMTVDIKQNNQKVELTLAPNFGYLELKPNLAGNYGNYNDLRMTVDGKNVSMGSYILDPGVHKVHVEHPCYDAIDFNAGIERQKTLTFDQTLNRGMAALELNTEWDGQPQSVSVYVDGNKVGSTPYSSQVPLCSHISVGENGWQEDVMVNLKWHEVSQVTYNLVNKPKAIVVAEAQQDSLDKIRVRAEQAYNELGVEESEILPESFKVKAKASKDNKNGRSIHWLPVGISSAVALAGVITAIVGNTEAKEASHRNMKSEEDFNTIMKDIDDAQGRRTVGTIIAIVGVLGVGLSLWF
ncbi:MAG: PEGA domain-containing protein [Fibrobacter sp.]|nr:PEGA domain-containing protein [Fibrobacter sp.]